MHTIKFQNMEKILGGILNRLSSREKRNVQKKLRDNGSLALGCECKEKGKIQASRFRSASSPYFRRDQGNFASSEFQLPTVAQIVTRKRSFGGVASNKGPGSGR